MLYDTIEKLTVQRLTGTHCYWEQNPEIFRKIHNLCMNYVWQFQCVQCVVVQFYPWFKFYFLLFLGIVMYDNEFETKENKIWTKDKIEPQHM